MLIDDCLIENVLKYTLIDGHIGNALNYALIDYGHFDNALNNM